MHSDITPGSVMSGFWKWAGVVALALALITAIIIGGQKLGFWLDTQNVRHQSNVIRLNYATQRSDLQQMTGYISTVTSIQVQEDSASGQQLADLKAQALGIGNQACQVAAQLSIPLGAETGWVRTNCTNGVVSTASPLRKG